MIWSELCKFKKFSPRYYPIIIPVSLDSEVHQIDVRITIMVYHFATLWSTRTMFQGVISPHHREIEIDQAIKLVVNTQYGGTSHSAN